MKIEREVVTTVKLDNGTVLNIGDNVKFIADDKCFSGTYVGVSKRGSLLFTATVGTIDIAFGVMPNSIKELEVQ